MVQEKLGKSLDTPGLIWGKGKSEEDGISDPDSCHPRNHWKTERGCLRDPAFQGKDWPQHNGCPLSLSGRKSPQLWSGRSHQALYSGPWV